MRWSSGLPFFFRRLGLPASACGRLVCAAALAAVAGMHGARAAPAGTDDAIRQVAQEAMREHGIAGMAIGVRHGGEARFYNLGVASLRTQQKVTSDTLFEVGSISKTYTATLAAYAQTQGRLALKDPVQKFVPELRGSPFGKLTLIHLGTHTGGGFPPQVPDGVRTRAQLLAYLKAWRPSYAPGTRRTYANPSIGMLGEAAARALDRPFDLAMEQDLFPALGLASTFLAVPPDRQESYAQGYDAQAKPVRLTPGVLGAQAYGVRTSARDLLRFVDANLGLAPGLDPRLRRALAATHVAYYQVDGMMQDLAWEQYAWPARLETLIAGNAPDMAARTHEARALDPPLAPQASAWINKTGSTNGFGAYVAFVPAAQTGIVILANRNWPNEARVRLAYRIMELLR